jgi:hypothetical protein
MFELEALMRKALLALIVAVAVVCSTAAAATSPTGQTEAFRSDVVKFLTEMQPVAAKLDASGIAGPDRTAVLANAMASVKNATPEQLAVLQKGFAAYPSWRTAPRTLAKLAARMPNSRAGLRPAAVGRTKITPDDCATARGWGYTQTDVEIAADVALAADAVLEAIPQDTLDEIVRAIAVGVWAIPQGVLRGFEHLYNIASACDDADHQALVAQNLDVKVSTRATQSSLDSLTTIVNNAVTSISNSFTSVLNAISTLKTDVDNSFTAVTNQITALKTDVDNSFTAVTNKIDNVQGSVNTANTNILTLTANVAANNALNIRLHIEEDLANPGNHPIGLFELPTAQGGYLELARSIVADVIAKTTASGQGVGNSQSFMSSGDDLRTAGKYKEAYAAYGKAYQAATK